MTLSIVTTLYESSPYIDEFYTRISKGVQSFNLIKYDARLQQKESMLCIL